MEFSSGRPYAGLLSPACTSPTLSFSNCGNVVNGAGPTPGIGLNSFYGPWLERIDVSLARSFSLGRGQGTKVSGSGFQSLQPFQLLRAKWGWCQPVAIQPDRHELRRWSQSEPDVLSSAEFRCGQFQDVAGDQPERSASRLPVLRALLVLSPSRNGRAKLAAIFRLSTVLAKSMGWWLDAKCRSSRVRPREASPNHSRLPETHLGMRRMQVVGYVTFVEFTAWMLPAKFPYIQSSELNVTVSTVSKYTPYPGFPSI
jgi:hypothetical protein